MFNNQLLNNLPSRLLIIGLIFFNLFIGAYIFYNYTNTIEAYAQAEPVEEDPTGAANHCLSDVCRLAPEQQIIIDRHCVNYIIKNNGSQEIFIPIRTPTELQEFLLYHPIFIELIIPDGGDVFCPTVVHDEITYYGIYKNGLCWLDRNLGATQVCQSSIDEYCYGDLYQWGRLADGHQLRDSGNTDELSDDDIPLSSDFINSSDEPFDWHSRQNNELWQGVSGINNPCPPRWRVPSERELETERFSWCVSDADGAFNSRLRWPLAGYRVGGEFLYDTSFIWSSSISEQYSRSLYLSGVEASVDNLYRSYGASVRCVIDVFLLTYYAESNGSLLGEVIQIIQENGSGSLVTAVPIVGYQFKRWSDGSIDNPRQDLNVTANISVTAEFEIMSCGDTTITHNGLSYGTIIKNGKCWLDRNLGATQICQSSTDPACYGDLYQWGRLTDGHQLRTSLTTSTLSTTDTPGHGNFITTSGGWGNADWRSPSNNSLWQGVAGINNPCPAGFRLPTTAELTAEMNSWSPKSSAGAFTSLLKFPFASSRLPSGGFTSTYSYLWTSGSPELQWSDVILFHSSGAVLNDRQNVTGLSVRCLRDHATVSLTYSAGPGGSISGQAEQLVIIGLDGTAVTAVPNTGYSFVQWSDSRTDNPRQDISVMANISVTAEFEIISCGHTAITYDGLVYDTIVKDGKCWLDRNLGATQICQSSTDSACYGDLYQWGRDTDGHQIRTSGTTPTLSNTDTPGHGDFITTSASPHDWRSPQNDNLWQGASGINNPCPSGFRLPTEAELTTEMNSWSSLNSAGAFASPLKLPVAGARYSTGDLNEVGSDSYLWSSTVSGTDARYLNFHSSLADLSDLSRVFSFSVRCLRDDLVYSLTYSAGLGGSISGQAVQSVPMGFDGTLITAVPDTGYSFVKWSDDRTDNPRQDTGVVDNINVFAIFSCGTYVLNGLSYETIAKGGECWLNRNLGATQICQSSTDSACYGDLYQWGRGTDGHQIRTSGTTATLSDTDTPGHANFITNSVSPWDWRSPQNDNLWQGASGINNPCPSGFRLPTEAELTTEMNSWSSLNSAGALASLLKFPMAGLRSNSGGLDFVGSRGYLWSSAVFSAWARVLYFDSSSANLLYTVPRIYGGSVRCLRD